MKKFYVICVWTFLFMACVKEEIDEFSGIISQESIDSPLSFLDRQDPRQEQEESDPVLEFEASYRDIVKWGELEFAQEETRVTQIENDFVNMLLRSRIGERQKKYYPIDTQIGQLLENKDISFVERKIYEKVDNFFNLIKRGELDRNISDLVLRSEIPLISRQISRSVEYASEISEVRVGEIAIVDNNKRSVQVRVLRIQNQNNINGNTSVSDSSSPESANNTNIDSRAQFRFYFVNQVGGWLINAIEGDFNVLSEQYESPGLFTPQGTTGVTQSF